jgi:urea transport system ATP-binding protein
MMLEIAALNQFYGSSHTLWDLDLKVEQGSCTCLMGRNGVGKTTLLKTIMGLVPSRSGEIRFQGATLTQEGAHKRARSGIAYVPQGREIFAQLTVEENLRTGLGAVGSQGDIPEEIVELFPVLRSMLRRRGGDLSGGQQQQLAIGRALALKPRLLILDEPTEGIQPNIVSQIAEILIELNRVRGLTLLLVEQKLAFAKRVADCYVILDRGRAVARDTMDALTQETVTKYLTV